MSTADNEVTPSRAQAQAQARAQSLAVAARATEADLPLGDEKTALVRAMFDTIAPRYDLVNRVMTFGLDRRWRQQSVHALGLEAGACILDLACGTGDFLKILQEAGLQPLGMDLSWGMLAANGTGQPLAQANAASLPVADQSVDGITCGYALRNFTDLGRAFDEFGRVIKPGGRISLLEVAEPNNKILQFGHAIWFRKAVPIIGGLLSNKAAYEYLPRSTAYLPSLPELRSMLRSSGFSSVNHRALTGGLSQLITATRQGLP